MCVSDDELTQHEIERQEKPTSVHIYIQQEDQASHLSVMWARILNNCPKITDHLVVLQLQYQIHLLSWCNSDQFYN